MANRPYQLRVKEKQEAANAARAAAPAKTKAAGRGRPKGYRVTEATREKLRARIKGDMLIDQLHELTQSGGQHDSVRATAAKILLDRILPTLQSTDLTSGGESITVERIAFTQPKGQAK